MLPEPFGFKYNDVSFRQEGLCSGASSSCSSAVRRRLPFSGRIAVLCACAGCNCNKSKFQNPIDCMDVIFLDVAFFTLSFSAVVVLFGSVVASLAWLLLWMLRLLVRLLAKL